MAIDRYYIERFLERCAGDIRGRVLEVGDAAYSERFGAGAIADQDVLHVSAGHPGATIVGDLSVEGVLPPAAFDCIILTQTLHLVYDLDAAIRQLHQSLAPGGVLLLTVPGISQIDRAEWRDTWFWAMTPLAIGRLLGEVFGLDAVDVESHGNVFAATTFRQGLALSEVPTRKLDVRDDAYPVIVAAWCACRRFGHRRYDLTRRTADRLHFPALARTARRRPSTQTLARSIAESSTASSPAAAEATRSARATAGSTGPARSVSARTQRRKATRAACGPRRS